MPLDKQVEGFLKQLEEAGGPPINTLAPEMARQAMAQTAAFRGEPDPVAEIIDRSIPGPRGEIPVRIYTPDGSGPFPAVVYFHGGGWVVGDLETVHTICTMLAHRAQAVVVSVDYRLAPEHKFPAAVDDAYAATEWVAAHAEELHADPNRLAVAGDSAGGNLTAVVSLLARDRKGPKLCGQVMFFPVTDASMQTASYRENAENYFLTQDMMAWFFNHYVNDPSEANDVRLSPMKVADASGLPPAFVATAEFDPLRDEGEAYAEKLRRAGNAVTAKRYDGMIHDFILFCGIIDRAKEAIDDAVAFLHQVFQTTTTTA